MTDAQLDQLAIQAIRTLTMRVAGGIRSPEKEVAAARAQLAAARARRKDPP
jgi:hypothetical protein